MHSSSPFFSIVIPTFNRHSFVNEAVSSCLNQTFTDFEIIVVDDGSTDSTDEQIRAHYGNAIRYFFQENSGAEEARNRGIAEACGAFIVFLDSDDMLYPDALYRYHEILLTTDAAMLISKGIRAPVNYSRQLQTTSNDPVHYSIFKDYLSKNCPVWLSTSFIIVKRQSLIDNGISFTKGTFPVDDLDFLLRAGTLGPIAIIASPVTVAYRYHDGNSVSDVEKNLDKLIQVLRHERSGCYPGGNDRAFDRHSIIGGHLQSWCRKGLKSRCVRKSIFLALSGLDTLFAIALKKILQKLRRHTASA